MKRIIDGKTYNKDTATLIARSWWNDWERDNVEVQADLYLTRGGAFFLVHTEPSNPEARAVFEPMKRENVANWLTRGEVEVFDESVFAAPEEAAEELVPEATIYVRVPRSLKNEVDARAKRGALSANAWVMRCVERCCGGAEAKRAADALGRAFYIARQICSMPDGYAKEQCHEALAEIENEIVAVWGHLDLQRVEGAEDLRDSVYKYSNGAAPVDLRQKWQPYQVI